MTEEPRLSSLGWMHASIRLSPLLAAHTNTTITVKQCEARLINENTGPSVPEVPLSVCAPPHKAATPVIQSQSGTPSGTPRKIVSSQKPYKMPWTDDLLRNRRIISTLRREAEMKRLALAIRINCLSSWAVVKLLRPPCSRWCARSASRLHHKILQTHPCDIPDILAPCQ